MQLELKHIGMRQTGNCGQRKPKTKCFTESRYIWYLEREVKQLMLQSYSSGCACCQSVINLRARQQASMQLAERVTAVMGHPAS